MPKNWVVRYWPFSAYQLGMPTRAGSSVNAPRGCLSRPMAMPMSQSPNRIPSAQAFAALAAVAQALSTLVKGMPDSPTMPTIASGFATVQLPPVANWTSVHSTPASATAAKMASTPISMADLPSNRPNGCRPTPMIATSFVIFGILSGPARGERDDLAAIVVGGVRHHGQLDVHTELEFRRVVFGQAALDADDVFQLYQPDTEGNERLARGPPVWRTGREAPRRPRHEGSVPRQQQFRRIAGAARGA